MTARDERVAHVPSMKRGLLTLLVTGACLVAASVPTNSPVPRKRISPHESVKAVVAGARLTIVYGRPSMRGRTIWGGLIRWGVVWTPGADEATLLRTDRMLVLEGRVIPPGTYSLYLHVDQTHPELIVNKQIGQWHTVYSPSQDLVRVPAKVSTVPAPVEQLTLSVDPAPGGGTLNITWDRVRYWVAFSVGQGERP
jgi:hypothetical protein